MCFLYVEESAFTETSLCYKNAWMCFPYSKNLWSSFTPLFR
ncbi:hypothetical protein Cs308_0826 [Candidatus Chlamydia sanziniae]|uniref:Uncharacterized protein n=1 Tax=Candidatus Chlamydia sanziniae TaxID=1806891 RepID=A0A1A9HYJ5_9CHLA|nr:hypothetical protein Cs308_0826 [Candidatus Chlamydia sanziniae]